MATPEVKEFNIADIHIEPDLKKLLPEVDDDAKDLLKKLIDEYGGIREPLTLAVINDKDMLLDGHNRLRVADELGYTTVPVVFLDEITDIVDAEIWMINNQLSRRNMSDMERIQVILKLEPELKEQAKARQRGEVPNSAQVGKVVQILADMAGVSRNTINQAKVILATGDADLIAITDKEISFNKAYKYASFPEEKRKAKIQAVIQKVSTKAEETTDEELEEITAIRNKEKIELKKETELSWIQRINEKHFWVYGVKLSDKINTTTSAIHVFNNNCALVDLPETISNRIFTIFEASGNDDKYNEILKDIATLADNIKTAKRLADPALKIARQAYLEAHPEAKPPKAPSAKDRKIEANKKEIEALLKLNNRLTEAQKAEFKESPLIHKALVKAINKAMNTAEKEFDTRISDARILGDKMTNQNLYEEQKEVIISTQYYAEEKTFKLRMRDRLSKLADIVKAVKESTPKAINESLPASEPQAVATKKKPAKTAKSPVKTPAKTKAKAKAPAKAKKKTSKPSTNPNALSADAKKDIAEYFNNNEEVQRVLNTIKKNDSFNPDTIKIGDVSFADVLRIMKERKETAMQNMIDNPKVVTSAEVFGTFGENIRAGIEKAARKKATAIVDTPKETLPE